MKTVYPTLMLALLTVAAGSPVITDIDYSITVRPGTNVSDLEPLIEDAIEAAMNKLKQGEILSLAQLQTAIINVDIDNITNATINSPAADIQPLASQLIRPGTVTRS